MFETRVLTSLDDLPRASWDALFGGALEGFDYLRAVESAALEGFGWRYVLVQRDGRLVGAAPAFITDYRLETTFEGGGRKVAEQIRRLAPGVMTPRLACLGSPCAETATVGFAAGLSEADRLAVLEALIFAFEQDAARAGCSLMGVKDADPAQADLWSSAMAGAGYSAVPGQAIADLAIDFADLETYLARLSSGARRDMRRKLRSRGKVRIELRVELGADLPRAMALYRQTLARADAQLETLTPGFFKAVAERMPGRAVFALYYVEDDLLAFNLLLEDGEVLLDKFFCMEAARGRAHNLYFLSWFFNLERCLELGLKRYQSGQANLGDKLRLGSRLTPVAMYFKHRNGLVNGALRLLAPLLMGDALEGLAA
ncbi:GNAT family N-acetyltransferase [Caulobacter sp. DWR2-3-1b2]|uniref:GNAT family N-acetyltransferase n=1 Tax=unclassified Caulobacter TaxID=2648921 RepID=UPI003CEDCA17